MECAYGIALIIKAYTASLALWQSQKGRSQQLTPLKHQPQPAGSDWCVASIALKQGEVALKHRHIYKREPGQLSWTHQSLHYGVVGGVHVGVEWKGTFPLAVIGSVALRRNDPVLVSRKPKADAGQFSPCVK